MLTTYNQYFDIALEIKSHGNSVNSQKDSFQGNRNASNKNKKSEKSSQMSEIQSSEGGWNCQQTTLGDPRSGASPFVQNHGRTTRDIPNKTTQKQRSHNEQDKVKSFIPLDEVKGSSPVQRLEKLKSNQFKSTGMHTSNNRSSLPPITIRQKRANNRMNWKHRMEIKKKRLVHRSVQQNSSSLPTLLKSEFIKNSEGEARTPYSFSKIRLNRSNHNRVSPGESNPSPFGSSWSNFSANGNHIPKKEYLKLISILSRYQKLQKVNEELIVENAKLFNEVKKLMYVNTQLWDRLRYKNRLLFPQKLERATAASWIGLAASTPFAQSQEFRSVIIP